MNCRTATCIGLVSVTLAGTVPTADSPQSVTAVHVASLGGGPNPGQFNGPRGIALDSLGRIFVADRGYCRIQVFDANGRFLYMWGSRGSLPGEFLGPWHIAIDRDDTVFVTDPGNSRVQVFKTDGTFLRAWGMKGKGPGEFNRPTGLAVDDEGQVYVSDHADRVQVFTREGVFRRAWGSKGKGDGQFSMTSLPGETGPAGIAVDRQGQVFVADFWNSRIQVFTREGQFVRKFGYLAMPGGAFNTPAAIAAGQRGGALNTPDGLAFDPDGNVLVVSQGAFATIGGYNVQKFGPGGEFLQRWGKDGYGPGQFTEPAGIAIDAIGNFYVADAGNNRIQKFNKHGQFLLQWGSIADGLFRLPTGLALDRSGNLLVADTGNKRVQRIGADGTFLNKWGKPVRSGWLPEEMTHPVDVAVDEDRVYVVDLVIGNVQVYALDGGFLDMWTPQTGRRGHAPNSIAIGANHEVYVGDINAINVFDATGKRVRALNHPRHARATDFTVDRDGRIYVVETHDDGDWSRIRVITPDGKEIRRWNLDREGEKPSSAGRVAVDASGQVFVTDWWRCRVRVFSQTGVPLGEWGSCGFEDGQFNNMTGIATGEGGLVYVSDYINNRVQVFKVS